MRLILLVLLASVCSKTFAQAPVITSFTPTSAATGTTVTINGSNFLLTSAVSFGGVNAASFNIVSATQITAVVGSGASGFVSVTNPSGPGTRANFYYLPLSRVITDFGGYWSSTTSNNNSTRPDNSHNLLAFTYNTTVYSTGVNNATLTANSIPYTSGNFKALPVAGISGNNPGGSVFLAIAKNVDGSATIANHTTIADYSVKSVLIDGVNGLNLGTGFTNLPSTAILTFNIFNINSAKIADAEPDILLTQIAQPVTGNDVFSFVDAAGLTVGNTITQDMTLLPPFGTYDLDLFNLTPAAPFNTAVAYSASAANTNREIRLVAFKLSDFGITALNVSQVKALKITPSGTSDYAFISYNANAINLPPNISRNDALTNTNVCTGGTANLSVIGTAAAGGALTYTWERSTDGGTTYTAVTDGGGFSGALTTRLTITGATNGDLYRAIVNEAGSGYANTSAVFTISVIAPVAVTSVTVASTSTTCLNTPVNLTSTIAGGGSSPMYQWQSSPTPGGTYTDIVGAMLSSYAPAVTATGATSYKLRVSSGSGCSGAFTSATPATITVNGISSTTGAARCGTGSLTLSATATSGSIDWYAADAGGVSLVTSNSYTTPSITATTIYYVASSGCAGALRVPVTARIDAASVGGAVTGGSSVCSGTNATQLTLSGNNGTVVKWQSSTDNFSSVITDIANTTSTLLVSNIAVTMFYRAVVQNGTCAAANSSSATITALGAGIDGLWTGAINTDWNVAGNWCSNTVPTAATNVLIPSGVINMPSTSINVTINNIEIQGSKIVNIAGDAFTINGITSGSGTFTPSSSSHLIIGGSGGGSAGTLNFTTGNNTLGSLTVNRTGSSPSVTLGNALVVDGVLTVTGGQLNTANQLTLASTATRTASVAPLNGSGVINGKVTVERYIQDKRAWRLLSVPVSGSQTLNAAWQEATTSATQNPAPGYGTHITGGISANGFDQTQTNSASIRIFDQAAMSFTSTPLTSTLLPINNQPGYFLYVRGDRSIDLTQTGTLSNTTTTLRSAGALKTGTQSFTTLAGYCTLIGNPYASAVDFALLTRNNVPARFYLWDPKLNLVGGYQTFDASLGYVPVPGGGSYGSPAVANSIIQSGQAFLVQGSGGAGSITFEEAAKATGSSNAGFRETGANQRITIRLNSVGQDSLVKITDAAVAVFADGYNAGVDNSDARKMINVDETFALQRDEKLMSIERRPVITANDTLFIRSYNLKLKNYQLVIDPADFVSGTLTARLEDAYLKSATSLSLATQNTIPFSVTADAGSSVAARFRIVFTTATTLPVKAITVKAVKTPENILVSWSTLDETGVEKYEVEKSFDGVAFTYAASAKAKNNGGTATYEWVDRTLPAGTVFYRIKITDKNQAYSYSEVVRVHYSGTKPVLSIYPNPVTTTVIRYQVAALPKGTYTVRLYNAVGQVNYVHQVRHSGNNLNGVFSPGTGMAKGLYRLVVSNAQITLSQNLVQH